MYNITKVTGHNDSAAKKKLKVLNAFMKNLERSHTSNLVTHLKTLEQKDIPRRSRR